MALLSGASESARRGGSERRWITLTPAARGRAYDRDHDAADDAAVPLESFHCRPEPRASSGPWDATEIGQHLSGRMHR
jgi:hypothetical protein